MPGQRDGEVDKELPGAGADQHGAKQDKQDDVSRGDEDRDAEDTVGADELDIDEFFETDRRAVEHAEEMIGVQCLDDEEAGNQDHCPADRAAGGFQHQDDQQPAHIDIAGIEKAFARLEFLAG